MQVRSIYRSAVFAGVAAALLAGCGGQAPVWKEVNVVRVVGPYNTVSDEGVVVGFSDQSLEAVVEGSRGLVCEWSYDGQDGSFSIGEDGLARVVVGSVGNEGDKRVSVECEGNLRDSLSFNVEYPRFNVSGLLDSVEGTTVSFDISSNSPIDLSVVTVTARLKDDSLRSLYQNAGVSASALESDVNVGTLYSGASQRVVVENEHSGPWSVTVSGRLPDGRSVRTSFSYVNTTRRFSVPDWDTSSITADVKNYFNALYEYPLESPPSVRLQTYEDGVLVTDVSTAFDDEVYAGKVYREDWWIQPRSGKTYRIVLSDGTGVLWERTFTVP